MTSGAVVAVRPVHMPTLRVSTMRMPAVSVAVHGALRPVHMPCMAVSRAAAGAHVVEVGQGAQGLDHLQTAAAAA